MGFRMFLQLLCTEGSRLLKCEEMSQNSYSSHTGIILTFCPSGISDVKKIARVFGEKHIYAKYYGWTTTNKGSCILVVGCWLQRNESQKVITSAEMPGVGAEAIGGPTAPSSDVLSGMITQVMRSAQRPLRAPGKLSHHRSSWSPPGQNRIHKEWGCCWGRSWESSKCPC